MDANNRRTSPDSEGRDFDMLQKDLQRGWSDDAAARHAERSRTPGEVREDYNPDPESVTARENANRPMDPAKDLSDRASSEPEGRL